MVRDLDQRARARVEVDPLLTAKPHAVRIGDGAAERFDELAFVDRPLRGWVEAKKKLAGRVVEEIFVGDSTTARSEDSDQRSSRRVNTHDFKPQTCPVKPLAPLTGFDIDAVDLIGKDSSRRTRAKWTWVSWIHGAVPEDSRSCADLGDFDVCHLVNRARRLLEQPDAGPDMLERLGEVDTVGRIIEDLRLSAESGCTRRFGKRNVLAALDADEMDGEDAVVS